MDNLDLIHYVEQARKSGMGDEEIRQGLLQSGWPLNDINEAMMKAPAAVMAEPRPKTMMSRSLAVIFIAVVLIIGGYFAGAYYMANYQDFPLWPFEVSVAPLPIFTPRSTPGPTRQSFEGQFCGGIAAIACPEGYECILDSNYPDAGGKCTKSDMSDMSDWQIYRNEEYGFEFKYPESWAVNSESVGDGELFTVARATFSIQDRYLLGLLVAPLGVERKSVFDGGIKSNCEVTITIFSGRSSKKCFESNGTFGSIRVVDLPSNWNPNNEISFAVGNENKDDTLIFSQILSTFRFIE